MYNMKIIFPPHVWILITRYNNNNNTENRKKLACLVLVQKSFLPRQSNATRYIDYIKIFFCENAPC